MSPEPEPAVSCFVLLCRDADFSRAVMRALARRRFLPQLVVLPEFAPAAAAGSQPLHEGRARRDFPPEFDDIEFAYAPPALQVTSAETLRQRGFGFMLVACWPYLLQQAMLDVAEHAALNLHPSLLPAYRGADPIGAQLEARDYNFGITLHQLDSCFDQGDIIAQRRLPAAAEPPARAELERQCADLGVELFIEALRSYPDWRRRPQPR